ncbi:pyroglutamyl peptidase [Nocardiopsis sinuspersici]|uniref:Pyroglutamyl peptidase n=1 Tax=Nocardiopsis sinuspersici TaxID=501010 RepID=A0A1V3C5B9_9ACTN|nr:pyroglutamyl peptidase [Nocardiopsis sinuspersici]
MGTPTRNRGLTGRLAGAGLITGVLALSACSAAGGSTAEEERVAGDVPQEILRRSGFDTAASDLADDLRGAGDPGAARAAVERHGAGLWRAAVDRAQGEGRVSGDLGAGDDRPLYWARLGMVSALREWEPSFPLEDAERAALVSDLEGLSRGHGEMDFPEDPDALRVVVTGFDPFGGDRDGNPSGAAALALDGTTVRTESGPVAIEAAVFPVRWSDFTDGMVERVLLPHYTGGRPADAVVTVSQGGGGFDLEAYNGAWRGGSPDNVGDRAEGMIPVPEGVPTVDPQPQWSESTLDRGAIAAAETGRFPVRDSTGVVEVPEGESERVDREDGPTAGSTAVSGSGGDYLSNEIAYRNTLLRDATGRDIPAGHVHTPVPRFGTADEEVVTDEAFERDRADIVDQVRAIVLEAVAARP